ncbi:MAG: aminodeoxychorismate/anthranilate synthase component II [Acetivibrionales bacterium]|jgi:anthranilate synthase component 2|nr:aminodeoxychorismate/anthranilate synthase component II [Bacillota bacterium]NLP07265.1 aminodeoxychorismate/anthranilate synthase component II [Clostridiaceae bacterium]HOA55634.1 aminodeoxychorismate/anthranilate synthase component II [Clostridiales bacterium]HQD30076.1 aminodeoxychorismate/anthranilate synthase component II [Clostridiales bacterium]
MILVVDNYSSFAYNLVQLAGTADPDVRVIRNDEVTVDDILKMQPSHLVISSGPGHPGNTGICQELILRMKGKLPILGICLGHLAICEVFGAAIVPAKLLAHGKQDDIHIANGSRIFKGLPPVIQAGRYHSLAAQRESLPDDLLVIAEDSREEIMGVKHRDHEIYGLQFHPGSILTPEGAVIMDNFLRIGGGRP